MWPPPIDGSCSSGVGNTRLRLAWPLGRGCFSTTFGGSCRVSRWVLKPRRVGLRVTCTGRMAHGAWRMAVAMRHAPCAMRPVQVTRKPTRRGLRTQRETLQEPPKVVLKQPLPNGQASRNLVFPTPELHDPSIGGGPVSYTLDLTGYAPTAYRLPPTAYRRDCKASGPAEPSQQSTLFRKSWTMGPPLPKGKLSGVYPPELSQDLGAQGSPGGRRESSTLQS